LAIIWLTGFLYPLIHTFTPAAVKRIFGNFLTSKLEPLRQRIRALSAGKRAENDRCNCSRQKYEDAPDSLRNNLK
jgi:hypothetical protein